MRFTLLCSCMWFIKYNRTSADYLHGLAGVDELFAKCTRFCVTALAHHAFSKRIRGGTYKRLRIVLGCLLTGVTVSGLLVTGRSGAGKTALLHAVSKAMQNDPRTLTRTSYSRMHTHLKEGAEH